MTRESPVRHMCPCAQPTGSGRGASVELELWEAPGRRGSRRGRAGLNPGALQAGRGTARTQGEGFDSARHAPSGAGGQSVRPGGAAPGTRGERRASGWAGGAGPPVPTAARSRAAGRQPGWTLAAACPPPWDRQGSAARSRVTRPMFARYAQTTFAYYSAVKTGAWIGSLTPLLRACPHAWPARPVCLLWREPETRDLGLPPPRGHLRFFRTQAAPRSPVQWT